MLKPGQKELTCEAVDSQLRQYKFFHSSAGKVLDAVNPGSDAITLQDWLAYAARQNLFLRRLFSEFDHSGSGSINRHEFKKSLESIRLTPTEGQVRALIASIDRPSGPNGACPPNGKLEFSEFRDFMLLANPSGKFVSFSLLADEWLQHADDFTGGAAMQSERIDNPKATIQTKTSVPVWTSAVAGAIGNAFSRTAIAPLERVRMQMITDPGRYPGVWTCLRTIFKEEGIQGLWRGNSINVMRIAPQGAIAFFAKDYFKELFKGEKEKATPLETLGASMASGIFCQTGVYPLDTIRTRITTSPGVYKGLADAFVQIPKQEGALALFKGLVAANWFAVPYYGTQFFTYDMMKDAYSTWGMPEGQKRHVHPLFGIPAGSVASMAACTVAFPLQMAWKRIQVQGIGGRPIQYKGTIDCLTKVIKTEGAAGVYAGLTANLIKLAPTGALTFMCVEAVKDAMGWR